MMTGVTANPTHDPAVPQLPKTGPDEAGPDEGDAAARYELLGDLASLTLPLMWTLRQASVRALEPLGLRPTQGLTIGLIAQGVRSPKALSDLLDLAPSMVSAILGELEARGLVERRTDPDDRRRVHVALSDEGVAATERLTDLWTDVTRERLGHLSTDDLATLVRIYRSFVGTS